MALIGTLMGRVGWAVAAIVTAVLVTVGGSAVWVFGLAQYGEDYCFSQMRPRPPERLIVKGPFYVTPVTIECRSAMGNTRRTDPLPLLWSMAVLGSTALAAGGSAWWLIRRPDSSRGRCSPDPTTHATCGIALEATDEIWRREKE